MCLILSCPLAKEIALTEYSEFHRILLGVTNQIKSMTQRKADENSFNITSK